MNCISELKWSDWWKKQCPLNINDKRYIQILLVIIKIEELCSVIINWQPTLQQITGRWYVIKLELGRVNHFTEEEAIQVYSYKVIPSSRMMLMRLQKKPSKTNAECGELSYNQRDDRHSSGQRARMRGLGSTLSWLVWTDNTK